MARILLVEDEPGVRLALRLLLARAGHEVIEAETAREAWARWREAELVLLDWMLPDEPGLRWLERLREDPAGARLPVLMLTARAAEGDRVAGLLGGADDYLTKPYSEAELLARIQALLRRSGRPGRRPAPASRRHRRAPAWPPAHASTRRWRRWDGPWP